MNIKYNSKKVKKGDIFIALRTNNDGHKYIEDAINNGASKVIVEYGNYPVETIVVENTKEYLIKYLYDNYYDDIKDLKLIGITGTNGKTTTSMILHDMLNKLGRKTAYIGTNGFYINDFIRDLPNTTPEIIDIYELLLEAKKENCEFVCIEASSHGLHQNRLEGLKFDFGIFTNLTHEHLGYHKTMKNYAFAKQKLFNMLRNNKYAIINIDDDYKDYFLLQENNNVTYGFYSGDYYVKEYTTHSSYSKFSIINNDKEYIFSTELLGKHNIYNCLASIVVLNKIGYEFDKINEIMRTITSPAGRMENISYHNNSIIIDYAHTPDGIRNILETTNEFNHSRIITVMGCGGGIGSDRKKREEMGFLVLSLSNVTIFTNDNPRDEDPNQIINDLLKRKPNDNYLIELNRKKAIKRGMDMLTNNDILLILGKGNEEYQIIGNTKIYFNDKKTVMEFIMEE